MEREEGPGSAGGQEGRGLGKGLSSAAHRHGGAVRRQPVAGRPLPPAIVAREAAGAERVREGSGRRVPGALPAPFWRGSRWDVAAFPARHWVIRDAFRGGAERRCLG